MSNRALAQNTTFLTVALALQKILSFIYFIFIARFIGVENTGKFSFAMSFATVFAIFLDFGLTQILIRESARDHRHSAKYLANILGFKVAASLVIYGLMVVAVNWLAYPEITRQMVYVAGLVMLLDSFTLSFYGVLRGHHNLRFESLGIIANQVLILIFGLISLFLNLGLVVLVVVYLIGSLFNFIFSLVMMRRHIQVRIYIEYSWPIIKKILILAVPFGLAGIFMRIFSSVDIILLSKLSSDHSVGIYSVAYKITFALQFIALAFSASLYPAFSHYYVSAKQMLVSTFVKAQHYLLVLSLPVSVGVALLGEQILVAVFGLEYQASAQPLVILIASLVFIFAYFPIGAMLNACDRQSLNGINLAIVTLFNIILNLILIPLFDYNGAAVAVFLSYGLLVALGLIFIRGIISYNWRQLILSLFKVGISAGIMGVMVQLLSDYLFFGLLIPLGALVYFLVLFLVGGLAVKDIWQFKQIILNR